jgi:uncharacterized Zn finger protein
LKPAIEKIRSLCTSESFQRGVQYLREGRVRELEVSESVAIATVRGTRNYRVEIDLEKDFESTCTCPYDYEGYCKHIVATLIALTKDYEGILKRSELERNRLEVAFQKLSGEKFKDFLKKEFLRDKVLKNHFMIYATGEVATGGKSVDDYKKDVIELYDDASENDYIEYGNEIDFGGFVDLAQKHIERGNFPEATKVYQALSEAIAENMNMVDDSDGYYGERFSEAIESLSSCVNSLEGKDKVRYISYLFEKFVEKEPDYFQEVYDEALRRVCRTREEMEHLRKLLRPLLPNSLPDSKRAWHKYYDSVVVLNMQAFVLDGLANSGDEESRRELYELFGKCYLQDGDFCLLYVERLKKDGKLDQAIKVAEEGLRVFQPHLTSELRRFLNKHYEVLSPAKYKENLKKLFYQELDWSYYEKLKKLSGNLWNSTLPEIIEHFSSRNARYDDYDDADTILIDIYVKERMFEAALKEVVRRKSLRILSKYYKHLADRYPREYYSAYRELLTSYADKKLGRDYYHEVASHLKKMKAIKDFDKDFQEYLEMLRERYARRPAFLDELKRL